MKSLEAFLPRYDPFYGDILTKSGTWGQGEILGYLRPSGVEDSMLTQLL